jgi:hypothetical protein
VGRDTHSQRRFSGVEALAETDARSGALSGSEEKGGDR